MAPALAKGLALLLGALACFQHGVSALPPIPQGGRAGVEHTFEKRKGGGLPIADPGYPSKKSAHSEKGWNSLPQVPGAKVDNTTFKVGTEGAVVTTYITEQFDPKKIKRAVIQVHGDYRDAWNQFLYANMSMLTAQQYGGVKSDEVVIVAPMFFNQKDTGAFPADAQNTSTTSTLVFDSNGWGDGNDAIWPSYTNGKLDNKPHKSMDNSGSHSNSKDAKEGKTDPKPPTDSAAPKPPMKRAEKKEMSSKKSSKTNDDDRPAMAEGPRVGSIDALESIANYFGDRKTFPNLQTIVISGFSLGGQMINRYITFRADTSLDGRTNYVVSSPGSFVYLTDWRKYPPGDSCKNDFNEYKYGLKGKLPPYVYRNKESQQSDTIISRFLNRTTYYFVGGDDTNKGNPSCSAQAQGHNHTDKIQTWVYEAIPKLPHNPSPGKIPKNFYYAELAKVTHADWLIYMSQQGVQALFLDDYNGKGQHAPGPRPVQPGGSSPMEEDTGLKGGDDGGGDKSAAAMSAAPSVLAMVTVSLLAVFFTLMVN